MRLPLAIAVLAAATLSLAAPPAHAEYRGRLVIRHSDDFARERTTTTYRLVRHGRSIRLQLTRPPRIASGSRVVVRGRLVGSRIRGTVRPRGIARAATVPTGPRDTAVILINFTTDTREPWTPDVVRQRVFTDPDSTNAFFTEESSGDVTLDGEVFGWYTVSGPTAGCNTDTWATQARSAAAADGFVTSQYEHIAYVFPQQASCGGWAGLGQVPGKQTWMNGTISTRVIAHELGHNMGLHHASSLRCLASGTAVTYSPSGCTPDEYGDPFDVMGAKLRRNHGWHLKQLGGDFMPAANVQVASSSGTYTLASSSEAGAGTRLLRVPQPGVANWYYDLELRSSAGAFDDFLSSEWADQGVTIRLDSASQVTQSLLLDGTPGTSSFNDAPLKPGQTFTDGTVTIGVTSVSALDGTATVEVSDGTPPPPPPPPPPPADTTAPSVPGSLVVTPAANSVALTWQASSDDVGVSGYRIFRDGFSRGITQGTAWTDQWVTPGSTYSYSVEAFDAAGNSAESAPVSVTVPSPPATEPPPAGDPAPPGSTPADPAPPAPDPTPPPLDPPIGPLDLARPQVAISSPARRARVRRRAVVRAAATDDVAVVRTEVWVDGVLRRSVSRGSVAWRWRARRARRGRHLILVRAYDAAGNHGVSSVRVRVVR